MSDKTQTHTINGDGWKTTTTHWNPADIYTASNEKDKVSKMLDEYYYWDDVDADLKKEDKEEKKANYCSHEWKTYTGLAEQFQYCTKCGIKK